MTEYVVSYSKAHETAQVIGRFTSFDEAEEAARQWGAVGEGQKSGRDLVYDVGDHEGDDDYGIWIEALREGADA
jgi:hypothetical protein